MQNFIKGIKTKKSKLMHTFKNKKNQYQHENQRKMADETTNYMSMEPLNHKYYILETMVEVDGRGEGGEREEISTNRYSLVDNHYSGGESHPRSVELVCSCFLKFYTGANVIAIQDIIKMIKKKELLHRRPQPHCIWMVTLFN